MDKEYELAIVGVEAKYRARVDAVYKSADKVFPLEIANYFDLKRACLKYEHIIKTRLKQTLEQYTAELERIQRARDNEIAEYKSAHNQES
jgi:hypothetical protein